jgi:DNA-directed RNA polymerase subunit alpha
MTVQYGKFEMPEKIKVDEKASSLTFTRFIAEPFERGYAHTIGSALRRIMLTSMEAPAIISVRLEGVSHEYTAIPAVVEDMTHILLNFKGALLRKLPMEEESSSRQTVVVSKVLEITEEMIQQGGGFYRVLFKDLMGKSDFECITPDLHVFTVTKPLTKRVDLKIGFGRGYVSSERHDVGDKGVDEIIIDTTFSPVQLVNYYVENTRVGQDTDYDRLILDITTDGRITPQEALTFATQIGVLHLQVFDHLKIAPIVLDEGEVEANKDKEEILHKLALKIDEIELSVRSTNCLSGADIETIGELVVMPESEMLKFRNFGKKSLTEIKQKLDEMSLGLGMDLSKYGITRENIKTVIDKYLEEREGGEV